MHLAVCDLLCMGPMRTKVYSVTTDYTLHIYLGGHAAKTTELLKLT